MAASDVHGGARNSAPISQPNSTAARPSPSGWSIGPMKKARVSAAACSARPPSPARTPSTPIASARTKTASAWKTRFAAAASRSTGFRRRARNRRTPPPTSNCTSNRVRCSKRLGLPLGVVLGTKGVERHAITFHGQEAHSGSTPMNARRDALAAAAKLALEIRTIAGKHPDAVCTMGSVKTFPGIVTAVVGRCEATLDQRDLDAAGARAACIAKRGKQRTLRAGREMHRRVVADLEHRARAVPSGADRTSASRRCRKSAGLRHRLPSGPLHDAAEVARAGIPTVMMFVQSLQGISQTASRTPGKSISKCLCSRSTGWHRKPWSGCSAEIRRVRERSLPSSRGHRTPVERRANAWRVAAASVQHGIALRPVQAAQDRRRGTRLESSSVR